MGFATAEGLEVDCFAHREIRLLRHDRMGLWGWKSSELTHLENQDLGFATVEGLEVDYFAHREIRLLRHDRMGLWGWRAILLIFGYFRGCFDSFAGTG